MLLLPDTRYMGNAHVSTEDRSCKTCCLSSLGFFLAGPSFPLQVGIEQKVLALYTKSGSPKVSFTEH